MTGSSGVRRGPLRAGIVGAGLMGRWHADAAARAGARVVAVADTRPDEASRLAARYRGAVVFAGPAELFDAALVDVVHVCTPTETHCEVAGLAIDAGLHAVVEKPLAPTAAETAGLLRRAAARGVTVCPVHQFPFQEGIAKATRLLPRIGHLVHASCVVCSAGGTGLDAKSLDAIVDDVLPHPLSLFQRLLPPGSLAGDWTASRPRAGELRAACESTALTMSVLVSLHARPTVCALTLAGTQGAIHADLFHGYSVLEHGVVSRARKVTRPFSFALTSAAAAAANLGRRAVHRETAYPGLRRFVAEVYQAIQTGSRPPIAPEEVVEVARVRDALVHIADGARLPNRSRERAI